MVIKGCSATLLFPFRLEIVGVLRRGERIMIARRVPRSVLKNSVVGTCSMLAKVRIQ